MQSLAMKSSILITAAVVTIAFSLSAAHAAPPSIKAEAKAAPATDKQKSDKAAIEQNVQATVPRAEFQLPRKYADGRDPFFPNSTRPYASETVQAAPTKISEPDVDFILKGISGTTEQPLAIINTTTFTTGEENEIIFKTRRIKIRCIEINMTAGNCLIEYGGTRRQLKLSANH
jgi:hypothetical protein